MQSNQETNNRLSASDIDALSRYFVGNNTRLRENIVIPRTCGPVAIKTNDEKRVEMVFESCPFKASVSFVLGKYISGQFYIILLFI